MAVGEQNIVSIKNYDAVRCFCPLPEGCRSRVKKIGLSAVLKTYEFFTRDMGVTEKYHVATFLLEGRNYTVVGLFYTVQITVRI